jgi:serine/threonine protein kinase/Flp pilus assembly protein TadD
MSLQPGTRLGPYEIVAPLGAGGMGEVYRARDTRLGREVAIKGLPEAFAKHPERLARFEGEARLLASLNHPNIASIFGLEESAGTPYLVLELVEGETLAARLARGPLSVREALELGAQVAAAVEAAHDRGVIHRDLKPANVMITPTGSAKVLDFGLAKLVAPSGIGESAQVNTLVEATEAGVILGTAAYMSPEQARGRPVDRRSDVWSFGCVLYECLAGRPAFEGETVSDLIARILEREPDWTALPAGTSPLVREILKRCLRKDAAERPRDIRDVRLELIEVAAGGAAGGRSAQPSVAVLPFINLSADPENEFFADGITEDVIAHLTKVRSLKVISRTSVMAFKKRESSLRGIGAALGASAIVEGSVRRAGNRVRIVAQLIDAATDEHIWAETYDRDLNDIFEIQTDVALKIAASLQAELSPVERARIGRPPTADLEAYQLYLQGRQCFTKFTPEGYGQSIALFEQAIAKDPKFALAHTALAYTYTHLGIEGVVGWEPALAYSRAKEAVARALALDDGLGEAHGIAGMLRFVCDFDWTGAERELRLAMALSPGSADIYDHFGWLCSSLGRYDEAIAAVRRARELDPLAHRSDVASELVRAGRYAEALAEATPLVQADPGYARANSILGWAHLKLGHVVEGVAALERAAEFSPGLTMFRAQLGQAYAMTGAPEKARTVLAELHRLAGEQYVSPYHFAYVHTGLGEQDAAIDWLERAYEQRAGAVYGIKGSFLFTDLRGHPRFVALLRKMNLA